MKAAKPKSEKKSPGTVIVEKYRPRLNKLSRAEREKLMSQAMRIAYGEAERPADSHRR